MANEETHWSFILVKGGSFSHTLEFYDDAGSPFDIGSTTPRLLVKPNTGSDFSWTLAGGHFTKLTGPDSHKIRFDLTTVQINALGFKAGAIYFYLNDDADLLFSGTVQVK